jgi:hypothetical protein
MGEVIRISLSGDQFRRLVMGEAIRIEGKRNQIALLDVPDVELSLQDIGFEIMKEHILVAEREAKFGV